jgi:molybdenum cofactor guanylyltransferase
VAEVHEKITGVVLAGGQSRRMAQTDKGLQLLRGKPMIEHILARLVPQVDEVLINANLNINAYGRFGYPVISDRIAGFAGPLAGLHAGLGAARHELVVTVPCDSPFLPEDIVARLLAGLNAANADLAVAKTFDQPHPVFCLARKQLLPNLSTYLAGGGRKFHGWYESLNVVKVQFDDQAEAFSNINTPEELAHWEK